MKLNKRKTGKRNNAGSAIVLVIVVMAIMGILVSTILYMALANYQMKINDLQSKDNFYTAETVLDEIRVGLQKKASTATDIAYMNVIQNYDLYADDASARRSEFVYQYINSLRKDLMLNNDDRTYDIEKLKNLVKGVEIVEPDPSGKNQIGAEVTVIDGKDSEMVAYTEALVLKNLRVKYMDKKGYVSIITTDIRIGIPDISFENGLQIPEIISYSLIANDQIVAGMDNTNIAGCVYAGYQGIVAEQSKGLHFSDSDIIVTPSKVLASTNGSITMDSNTNLWAQNAEVDGGVLKLLGNTYMKDDTNVEGRGSELVISGKYMGFGMDNGGDDQQAEDSSAIVINGIKSKVDLSGISRLFLPGNTYISYGSVNNETYKNKDKRLGESLTAKVSQVAYLVPSECIGWVKEESSEKYKCVLGTNPVLYSKYEKDFNPTNEDLSLNDRNQLPLPEKIEVDFSQADENYAVKYGAKYERVFVPTTDGDTLIYYYMTFSSQESASKFFQEYFTKNKDKISQYLDIYIDNLMVNTNEEVISDINIAGNVLHQVKTETTKADGTVEIKTEYELINETKSADTAKGIDYSKEVATYESVFKGLTTKLVKDASQLENDEIKEVDRENSGRGLFYNIIDVDQLNNVVGANNTQEFRNDDRDVKAVMSTKTEYYVDHETDPETSLIIAKGNVHVTRPFTGTIISGGTIYIECSGGGQIDIGYDEEMVRKVLDIEDTISVPGAIDPTKVNVMSFFKDGENMISASGSSDNDKKDNVEIEELVTYDNWKKE